MKKLLFAGLMAVGFLSASAQKIGYINFDEVVGSMPEAAKAQATLAEFQQTLAERAQEMMREVSNKDSAYAADSLKMTPTMRELKKKDIFKLYQEAQAFQQQGAQEQMQQKQNEVGAPIRDKAIATIKLVAKENNYAYVLEEGSLLVMPPADNLLALVKAKLGIRDTPVPVRPAPKKP
jgi:outer membrane protein